MLSLIATRYRLCSKLGSDALMVHARKLMSTSSFTAEHDPPGCIYRTQDRATQQHVELQVSSSCALFPLALSMVINKHAGARLCIPRIYKFRTSSSMTIQRDIRIKTGDLSAEDSHVLPNMDRLSAALKSYERSFVRSGWHVWHLAAEHQTRCSLGPGHLP